MPAFERSIEIEEDDFPPETAESVQRLVGLDATGGVWAGALAQAINDRRRAECMVRIQTDTVRLAMDLLVREPDITGFFRAFVTALVDETETRASAVWLLDERDSRTELWMARIDDRFFTKGSPDWAELNLPAEAMSAHLTAFKPGWSEIIEYAGDDLRLPEPVRAFNNAEGIEQVFIAPLALPSRNLGWLVLSGDRGTLCIDQWRRSLLDAVARQVTLALHQHQIAEEQRREARHQAVLEERNRLARDIHDTLAQGFAGILMQLQAAQRAAPQLPPAVAQSIELAVDLARTNMIEARRSVVGLRPQETSGEDVATTLQRMAELARRSTDVPIELTVADIPSLSGGAEHDIVGIVQEALTNAIRHAKAKRISVRAEGVRSLGLRLSVADDGRGIARERRGLGFGLTSMQERADRIGASLTIITAPRSGTEVVLAWEPPSFVIPQLGPPATAQPSSAA